MKKLLLFLSLVSMSGAAVANEADKKFSVGVGIGSAYSGVGANFALLSDSDMKYVSAGCVEYSSF